MLSIARKAKSIVIQPMNFWFSFGDLCICTVKRNALVANATPGGAPPASLLQRRPADVDVVYAPQAAPEHPQRALTLLPHALQYTIFPAYRRYYVDIEGSYGSYLCKFRSKTRKTWRRKLAKLEQASGGQVCWHAFRRTDEMPEFHRLACQISKTTYQEKLYKSGIPDTLAFRDQLERNSRPDLIRGYVLFFQQQPIAYYYCYAVGDVLVSSKSGYDPEFAQLSPGVVLLHLILEDLFERDRFRKFDFGRGEFAYKEHCATSQLRCVDSFYFPRTTKNVAFVAIHFGTALLSRSVSRPLAALGVKDAAKRELKNFAARRHGVLRPLPLDEGGQP
jgi:hypothetical protein